MNVLEDYWQGEKGQESGNGNKGKTPNNVLQLDTKRLELF